MHPDVRCDHHFTTTGKKRKITGGVFMKISNNLTELVGNTPLLYLEAYSRKVGADNARLIAKLEYFNPLGSVKDRTERMRPPPRVSAIIKRQALGGKLQRDRLQEYAACFLAGYPADQALNGRALGNFECHFPPGLKRARRCKAESAAGEIGDAGRELACRAADPHDEPRIDARRPRCQLATLQLPFELHLRSAPHRTKRAPAARNTRRLHRFIARALRRPLQSALVPLTRILIPINSPPAEQSRLPMNLPSHRVMDAKERTDEQE
jgi:hypothetical protein